MTTPVEQPQSWRPGVRTEPVPFPANPGLVSAGLLRRRDSELRRYGAVLEGAAACQNEVGEGVAGAGGVSECTLSPVIGSEPRGRTQHRAVRGIIAVFSDAEKPASVQMPDRSSRLNLRGSG